MAGHLSAGRGSGPSNDRPDENINLDVDGLALCSAPAPAIVSAAGDDHLLLATAQADPLRERLRGD